VSIHPPIPSVVVGPKTSAVVLAAGRSRTSTCPGAVDESTPLLERATAVPSCLSGSAVARRFEESLEGIAMGKKREKIVSTTLGAEDLLEYDATLLERSPPSPVRVLASKSRASLIHRSPRNRLGEQRGPS